jgi:hypothetical protein
MPSIAYLISVYEWPSGHTRGKLRQKHPAISGADSIGAAGSVGASPFAFGGTKMTDIIVKLVCYVEARRN